MLLTCSAHRRWLQAPAAAAVTGIHDLRPGLLLLLQRRWGLLLLQHCSVDLSGRGLQLLAQQRLLAQEGLRADRPLGGRRRQPVSCCRIAHKPHTQCAHHSCHRRLVLEVELIVQHLNRTSVTPLSPQSATARIPVVHRHRLLHRVKLPNAARCAPRRRSEGAAARLHRAVMAAL